MLLSHLMPLLRRHRAFLLFGVSGCLGLCVDVGVLALSRPWLGHYGGRVLSFLAAATFTWWFNRSVTFGAADGARALPIWREYGQYLASMGMGGAANYVTYVACVAMVPLVAEHPSLGVALGSLVGMGFNFWSARRILG